MKKLLVMSFILLSILAVSCGKSSTSSSTPAAAVAVPSPTMK